MRNAIDERIRVRKETSLKLFGQNEWDGACFNRTPMQYAFLCALEESGINDLRHVYLTLERDGQPFARANLYKTEMDFSSMDKKLDAHARKAIKHWYPKFMTFNLLECGFFTMIGEGIEPTVPENTQEAIKSVAHEMLRLAEEDETTDLLFIRDVPIEKYETYQQVLHPLGFRPVLGFPNAILDIPWRNLDEYLSKLDSKTRLKFKSSLKLEEQLNVTWEFLSDYSGLSEILARLWANVNEHAKDYSREQLTEAFFAACGKNLQDHSEVLLFRHQGRPIAFMLNMIGDEDYVVLDWGVDYEFEHYRKANLYRTATLLSLDAAIRRGKKRLELGITNYTPKMTLGASIAPVVYFLKHTRSPEYTDSLVRLIGENIEQPHPDEHSAPLRLGSIPVNIRQWQLRIREDQDKYESNDLFCKIGRYHRANSMRMAGIYGLYPEFSTAQQSSIHFSDGRRVVLLGTNSYLGAATHPDVLRAAEAALVKYGSGCSGSPLLNGTLDLHCRLEEELAEFLGREAVVLCSTGYQTNLAGLAGVCQVGDLIIMDARNHRSLFDGARLSGADVIIYRHNDMARLEAILIANPLRRKLIVADSLFSMEGTLADLPEICSLAKAYGARLYLDESHAIGVLGRHGRGAAELLGVEKQVDLLMGTFSKSFASIGGFIAGSKNIIDYIKHNAAAHIFSASMPPTAVATVLAVLALIRERPEMRNEILRKARFMAEGLHEAGYQCQYHGSQIVPVIFGNQTLALAAYRKFMEDGIFVNPIGPPAVPEEASGFRTSYMATHDWCDLRQALEVFRKHAKHLVPEINRATSLNGTSGGDHIFI